MVKIFKINVSSLSLAFLLCAVGCGGEKKSSNKEATADDIRERIKEQAKERFERDKNVPLPPHVLNISRAHELQKKIGNSETTLSDVKDFVEHHDFDVNQEFPTFAGQTFVHFAAKAGRLDIVKYLVEEKNADPDKHAIMFGDSITITPLSLAVQKGYSEIIIYLCSKGADLNVKNIKGETLFDIAEKKSRSISQDAKDALNPERKNEDEYDQL